MSLAQVAGVTISLKAWPESGFVVKQGTDHFVHRFQNLCGCLYLQSVLLQTDQWFHQAGRVVGVELAGIGDPGGVVLCVVQAALNAGNGVAKSAVDFHDAYLRRERRSTRQRGRARRTG